MLLIAGLLGLLVSGTLMALPMAGDAAPRSDLPEEDAPDDGTTEDTEDSLLTAGSPSSDLSSDDPEPVVLEITEPSTDNDTPELPLRDQIGGDHLTDRIAGTSAVPILHDQEAMLGNGAADSLTGTDASDLMLGNDGDDTLDAGAGRDGLNGGRGNDDLSGGEGDDILHGDAGEDVLRGGDGDDLLSGGDGNDALRGDAGDDRLIGGEGQDTLDGGTGDDILDGSLLGEDGADRSDADLLRGGAGDDTLAGDAGDTLQGGTGADVFLFRAPPASDLNVGGDLDSPPLIEDFNPSEDTIEIDYQGTATPTITLTEEDDVTHIVLDGVEVARVAGTPGVTAEHILLLPSAT